MGGGVLCGRIARIADRNIYLNILEKAQSGPNASAKADGPGAWEQASGHLGDCGRSLGGKGLPPTRQDSSTQHLGDLLQVP